MHASDTDLANTALVDILGKDPISDIASGNHPEAIVRRALPRAAETVLYRGGLWLWARRIANVAQVANDRETEWSYKHELPQDAAVLGGLLDRTSGAYVWRATDDAMVVRYVQFEIVGDHIYSHTEMLAADYVARRTDWLTWPDPVQWALAHELAARVAMPILKDKRLGLQLRQEADKALEQAIAWDRNRERSETPALSGMHSARFGG